MNAVFTDNGKLYYNIRGTTKGVGFNVIYQDDEYRDFQLEIEKLISDIDNSLSKCNPSSILSRINNNERVETDTYFATIFEKANEISRFTEGIFDISAATLFELWGCSENERKTPDDKAIRLFKSHTGMNKIRLGKNRLIKSDPKISINTDALIKGFAADTIAAFLRTKNCANFFVEIGREICVNGLNTSGESWKVKINYPPDFNPAPKHGYPNHLQLTNRSIATSNKYRYTDKKKRKQYGHIINTLSGYPSENNLLSASVIASDTTTADALATAFMAAGLEKALLWTEKYPDIDALFIYEEKGFHKIYCTPKVKDLIAPVGLVEMKI